MLRSILHCDMNNFYASVECMLDPALKKYPIAVCGSVEERHGIVLAKNYKAKAFDVKTGDAVWQAKQKCKDLVVVPPHYEEYIKYSKLARSVYERYTDQKRFKKGRLPRRISIAFFLASFACFFASLSAICSGVRGSDLPGESG